MEEVSANSPLRLQVVVGSTRDGRTCDDFLGWLIERAKGHQAFLVEVLDLRDWVLPMFQETAASARAGYSTSVVRRWNETVSAGDGYLFVTPEYNHSIPGVLKNAIDSVFLSFAFRNKPAGFVGYSAGIVGGARAVEQLSAIAIEAELVPLRNSVIIARARQAFANNGEPIDPMTDVAMSVLLDDLAWWASALRQARAAGELLPAMLRGRAGA